MRLLSQTAGAQTSEFRLALIVVAAVLVLVGTVVGVAAATEWSGAEAVIAVSVPVLGGVQANYTVQRTRAKARAQNG